MKRLVYWMSLEILLGIWLFFSPWVLGFSKSHSAAINSLILGSLMIFLGAGVTIYAVYVGDGSERSETGREASSS
jgi:hypothetical protein